MRTLFNMDKRKRCCIQAKLMKNVSKVTDARAKDPAEDRQIPMFS